jgi:hypothetical protein
VSRSLTEIEAAVLEELLGQRDACRGPDHPESGPEVELPEDVMEQLARDNRVRSWPCAACSKDGELVYHDRITSVGRLALRMSKLSP